MGIGRRSSGVAPEQFVVERSEEGCCPAGGASLAWEVCKIVLIVATIIMVSACGNGRRGYIDPAFEVYVQDFEEKINVKVNDVDIVFSQTVFPVIGLCVTGAKTNKISIDPIAWGNMDHFGREQLIYHELGHCVLYQDHKDTVVNKDGYIIQGSIMNSRWFGNTTQYRLFNEAYKKALKFNMSVVL